MDKKHYLKKAGEILDGRAPELDSEQLKMFVRRFLANREQYLDISLHNGSPLYLWDEGHLTERARHFRSAFLAQIPKAKFFYALKSNNHDFLINMVIRQGYGIDVSSGKELRQALMHNPSEIIFSGPGKTFEELAFACEHADRVTLLMDSFGELERLETAAREKNVNVRAGVRLMIEEKGLWRKFGIRLQELEGFFERASHCTHVDLCGLQFHASWNLNADKQRNFLKCLGTVISGMDARKKR